MGASLELEFAFNVDVRYIFLSFFFKYSLLGSQQMEQRIVKNG